MSKILPLLLAASSLLTVSAQPLPIFDLSRWADHADGGAPVKTTLVNDAIRMDYDNCGGQFGWGNKRFSDIVIPPNATGIAYDLFVEKAVPHANMTLWFFEPDGDGWLASIRPGNNATIATQTGKWIHVEVPFTAFNHHPRGDKRRGFLSCTYLLMGYNGGNSTSLLKNLQFVGSAPANSHPITPALPDNWIHPAPAGQRIAIVFDPTMNKGLEQRCKRIEALLTQSGFTPVRFTAGDLTSTAILNRQKLDLLLFIDGAPFPLDAINPFRNFLKQGGSFISLSGYPFDEICMSTDKGWTRQATGIPASMIDKGSVMANLNTRYGGQGDTMKLSSEQIGVCDPSYLLRNASGFRSCASQVWTNQDIHETLPLEGPAAVAMTGNNSPVFPDINARYIPLLEATDDYGRTRGPIAAVVLNARGVFTGSNWGFFTPTNTDLFDGRFPAVDQLLITLCRRLLGTPFLFFTETDKPAANTGDTVTITANVCAKPEQKDGLRLRTTIDGTVIATTDIDVPAVWTVPADIQNTFCGITIELLDKDGAVIDVLRNGIVIKSSTALQKGLSISLRDNYFQLNNRTAFFCGANTTGMMWYSKNENPLVWQRDFEGMRDYGLNALRILHFSPFCKRPGNSGHSSADLRQRPERTISQTDAIVQLAQEHQVMVFLSLHDWLPLDESDSHLEDQADWNRFWVSRYVTAPGMFYDVQNEPTTRLTQKEVIEPLFRRFLEEKYGSLDQAFTAWQASGAEPVIQFDAPSTGWTDLRVRDIDEFRSAIFVRWTKANIDAIHQANPQALATVGYLQSLTASDKFLGMKYQDFADLHHYGVLSNMRAVVKMMDRRYCGKTLSLGEMGSAIAHNARTNGDWGDPADDSIRHFLSVGHVLFGMGGSFMANWSWKDFQDCVFPWGINHADVNAKPVLQAYRNMALLFRQIQPRYESPRLFFVIPDGYRLGHGSNGIHEALRLSIDTLLTLNVPFGIINEWDLQALPKEANALIWPLAYAARDETFDLIRAFVDKGGKLLVTGDPRYGYSRQFDHPERLKALGLDASLPPVPPNTNVSDDLHVITSTSQRVFWIPAPLEHNGTTEQRFALYRQYLDTAAIRRLKTAADNGSVLCFELPLQDNGTLAIIFNASQDDQHVIIAPTDRLPALQADVKAARTALLHLNGNGDVIAVNCQGQFKLGERLIVTGDSDAAIVSLDGTDIARSRALLGLPMMQQGCNLTINGAHTLPLQEIGEFRKALWHRLGPQTDAAAAALDLRLFTTPETRSHAIQTIENLLIFKKGNAQ